MVTRGGPEEPGHCSTASDLGGKFSAISYGHHRASPGSVATLPHMRPAPWHKLTALTSGTVLAFVAVLVAAPWDRVSASDPTPSTATTSPRTNDRSADDQVRSTDDGGSEVDPLLEADAADPFVVVDGRQSWLFTTSNDAATSRVV